MGWTTAALDDPNPATLLDHKLSRIVGGILNERNGSAQPGCVDPALERGLRVDRFDGRPRQQTRVPNAKYRCACMVADSMQESSRGIRCRGRRTIMELNAPFLDPDYAFCGRLRLEHASRSINGTRQRDTRIDHRPRANRLGSAGRRQRRAGRRSAMRFTSMDRGTS